MVLQNAEKMLIRQKFCIFLNNKILYHPPDPLWIYKIHVLSSSKKELNELKWYGCYTAPYKQEMLSFKD